MTVSSQRIILITIMINVLMGIVTAAFIEPTTFDNTATNHNASTNYKGNMTSKPITGTNITVTPPSPLYTGNNYTLTCTASNPTN